MRPLISVIMSVFDTPDEWLDEAIRSILSQTFTDFEFIIVDDCCKESNKKILASFQKQDQRIVLLTNESNLGLTKSLNRGLATAKGALIARMDADDIADSTRLEKQIECFKRNSNLVLCGSQAYNVGNKTKTPLDVPMGTSNQLKVLLCWKNIFAHPSVMINADILRDNNIFYDENYRVAQDYELWCRLNRFGDVMNLPDRLCFYRVHEMQISSKLGKLQNYNRNKIIMRNLNELGVTCDEQLLPVFLSIMGYENLRVNTNTIVKEFLVLCYKLFIAYGMFSLPSIRFFLWNSFWMVKHNICGSHFRYFSK